MKQNKGNKGGTQLPVKRGPQIPAATKFSRAFSGLMKKNDEQTITVDDMVSRLPGADRLEVADFMSRQPGGDFIAGRRGHPGRFVFGEALKKWKHSEARRREWRIRNGLNPKTGSAVHGNTPARTRKTTIRAAAIRPVRTARVSLPVSGDGDDTITRELALNVTIGDRKVSIPLKVELEKVS